MIIKPRIRGFICTTAHPLGCAALVQEQIDYTISQGAFARKPRNVLVLGGSGGYGLASRIVAGFGVGASTICLSFEKQPEDDRTGTAGWYNNQAFDRAAAARGLYAKSLSADAFADVTKQQVADLIRADFIGAGKGKIDLLVYSLASPVRTDPDNGVMYRSAIKPIGAPVHTKTLNWDKAVVHDVDLEPATDEEIASTIKVMGGEDWERWIQFLLSENLLSDEFRTVSYTYIGTELTWPIYWKATLGKAKEDLDRAAVNIRNSLVPLSGDARVAVLKAVVTQASAAIPVVPLYASILFKVMKDMQLHEDCIRHINRLFRTQLFGDGALNLDEVGRIRLDDWELREDVQALVRKRWSMISTDNVLALADLEGFRTEFLRIFGFAADGVDYEADVDPRG